MPPKVRYVSRWLGTRQKMCVAHDPRQDIVKGCKTPNSGMGSFSVNVVGEVASSQQVPNCVRYSAPLTTEIVAIVVVIFSVSATLPAILSCSNLQ